MGKIAAAGSAIKNARLPSAGELKEGYLNSAFHKSLHQPLVVKTKVESSEKQKARQVITQVQFKIQYAVKSEQQSQGGVNITFVFRRKHQRSLATSSLSVTSRCPRCARLSHGLTWAGRRRRQPTPPSPSHGTWASCTTRCPALGASRTSSLQSRKIWTQKSWKGTRS